MRRFHVFSQCMKLFFAAAVTSEQPTLCPAADPMTRQVRRLHVLSQCMKLFFAAAFTSEQPTLCPTTDPMTRQA